MAEIQGLPEGIEVVRFGIPGDDDFELIGDKIKKGKRPGAASGVLVKPAEGYTFQRARWFDINSYTFQEIPDGTYRVVKSTPNLELKMSARFVFQNAEDELAVREIVTKLNNLPGYVEGLIE